MTTSVFRPFFAALAAVFILSACGGGQEEVSVASATASLPQAVASAAPEVSPLLMSAAKAAKAPVAKPAVVAVQSSGHKASAAPQAAVAAPYVSFTVGAVVEKSLPLSVTASTARVITGTQLMNWVEGAIPSLFPEHAADREIAGGGVVYQWRLYSNGNIIAVGNNGNIFGLGPYVGSDTVAHLFGTLTQFTCVVDPEMCRPIVVSTFPADGAVDVPSEGTVMAAKLDQPMACPLPITGTFGSVKGTLTCLGDMVTITPDATGLPAGLVTATLGGFTGSNGLLMKPHTWSFTVVKPVVVPVPVPVRVYTANYGDFLSGTSVASVIDVATSGVTQIGFPTVPGFGDMRRVVVDPLMRKVYFGATVTFRIYSIDLDTNAVLEPIAIDNDFNFSHSVMGLALSETDICMAFSRADVENYPRQNEFECRNRTTLVSTFKSPAYFLADAKMMTTRLSYLPFGNDKKLYALNATKGAYFAETLPDGGFREGFSPDTVGTVVAIDAATKAITTIQVGSVPQGIDRDPVTGDVYVTNGGDRTISVILHATGQVEKVLLSTFTGFQRPIGIKVDRSRGKIYVTDYVGAVVVLDLVTRQEVARVPVGSRPVDMVPVGNLLYVACRRGTSVFVIDLDTLKVTRTIQVGTSPWGIATSAP